MLIAMTNYNQSIHCFYQLSCLKDFKMTSSTIEAEGAIFYWNHMILEEAIIEALIFFRTRIEARRMVLEAKITLNE